MSVKKTKSLIRGGQLFMYNTKMFTQVVSRMTKWAVLTYLLIVVVLMLCLMPLFDWKVLTLQSYAWLLTWIGFGHVHVWTAPHDVTAYFTANSWLNDRTEQLVVAEAVSRLIRVFILSTSIGLALYIIMTRLMTRFFIKQGEKYAKDKIISGTSLASSLKETVKRVTHSTHGASDIQLGNVLPLPTFSVWQGILYHGSTGSGKTQGIMRLLDEIKAAGDPCIVFDKECSLKPYFFDERVDVELNPLSTLCARWDIWQECENPIELAALATYLMPKSVQGSDPFWVDAARSIFTSVAWEIRDHKDKSPIVLLRYLLTTRLDQLRELLQGSEAENLVSEDIEKTAISIRAVMATYTKSLRFLEGLEHDKTKDAFSIKHWVKEQANSAAKQKGWLYITSRAKFHAEIKPLLTAWLGMAMKSIQSLDRHQMQNKRFWIVMDEMASLNRLEDFSDIAADIRKFGGCIVVGIQSVSQLQFLYGRDEATAITDLLNTTCYYRSPKQTVADWVSKDLGEQIIEEVRESQSYGPNAIRDGNTIASQRVTRRTVDTSTIMQLADLECYVRLAGHFPVTRLVLPYVADRQVTLADALVERKIDWDAIKKIEQAANNIEQHPNVDSGVKALISDHQNKKNKSTKIGSQETQKNKPLSKHNGDDILIL